MSLQNIVKEIQRLTPISMEDLSEGPRETHAVREGRKRNAKDLLEVYREQYIKELRKSALFIIVAGTHKEDFANIAHSEFGCFTSDPEGFYKDLANRLPMELYEKQTPTANLFDILGRHLENKMSEMQVIEYPLFTMKEKYRRAINGKEEFTNLIKEAINEQIGSELVGIQVIREIADNAIKIGHSAVITPIVLTTDDEALVADLNTSLKSLGSKVFLVVAGKGAKNVRNIVGTFSLKEATKETVEGTLVHIKNLCKKNK